MASVTKQKNSKFWHAVFRVPQDGGGSKVVFRSTKKTNKREAMESAVDMERAARDEANTTDGESRRLLAVITRATEHAARGTLTVKRGRDYIREVVKIATGEDVTAYTVKEWVSEWMLKQSGLAEASQRAYKTYTQGFLTYLGQRQHQSIEGVTSADIVGFRQWLTDGSGKGKKVSANTVKNKTKCIVALFAEALAIGLIDTNPAAGIKQKNEPVLKRKPFTAEEVHQLILTCPNDEWRRFITLAAYTGLRMGDCMQIEWENVDLKTNVIEVIPQKTQGSGVEVKIPIHPTLSASLKEIKAKDRKGKVFAEISQLPTSGSQGMSVLFTALMDKAGVSRGKSQSNGRTIHEKSFHSLRHTLTSWLANADVSPEIRMKITGHKTQGVHAIYTHLEMKILSDAINSIPALTDTKS